MSKTKECDVASCTTPTDDPAPIQRPVRAVLCRAHRIAAIRTYGQNKRLIEFAAGIKIGPGVMKIRGGSQK